MNIKDVKIGLEFELFSKLPIDHLFESLERNLKKKLKYFNEGHSDFVPTADIWKLERDYSGGTSMYELVSGPLPYDDAFFYINKVFNFIKRNGYTTDKSAFQVNISLTDKTKMSQFNKLKFAVLLNEEQLFKDFPNREGNLYCKSIKHFIPLTKSFVDIDNLNPSNFTIPDSKYYGVNFTKLSKGYLEFRYFGGAKYEKNINIYTEYINEWIKTMQKSTNSLYTKKEYSKLQQYIKSKIPLMDAYKSYKNFKYAFPNIEVWVNLVRTPSFVETHYHMIKDKIFEIMAEANLTKGVINYNSDYSTLEIKEGEFKNIYQLKDVTLIDCELKGELTNCRIFESTINNALIRGSHIYQETKISNSKLNDCYVSSDTELKNCYITSNKTICLGQLTNCIFRRGLISKTAFNNAIDTEFIEYKYI